jgi:hypothetical protein
MVYLHCAILLGYILQEHSSKQQTITVSHKGGAGGQAATDEIVVLLVYNIDTVASIFRKQDFRKQELASPLTEAKHQYINVK